MVVKKDSPYQSLADLKGKKIAHTAPSSNSGHLAPLALFPEQGLKPGDDYQPVFSGGHDKTVLGVRAGDYDAGPVASDVFDRMVARGTVKADDFRIIYKSAVFPTSSFAYAHDLKPELAAKIKQCFYDFRFTPEMTEGVRRRRPLLPDHLPEGLGDRAQGRRGFRHALQQGRLRERSGPRGRGGAQEGRGTAEAMTAAPAGLSRRQLRQSEIRARSSSAVCARSIAPGMPVLQRHRSRAARVAA